MIAKIWKLSKTGWHVLLNGTVEQQLAAGMAIGAIVVIEKALFTICKSKRETKELEERLIEQLKKSDELIAIAEKDFSEVKEAFEETDNNIKQTKETQSEIEKLLKELDD